MPCDASVYKYLPLPVVLSPVGPVLKVPVWPFRMDHANPVWFCSGLTVQFRPAGGLPTGNIPRWVVPVAPVPLPAIQELLSKVSVQGKVVITLGNELGNVVPQTKGGDGLRQKVLKFGLDVSAGTRVLFMHEVQSKISKYQSMVSPTFKPVKV